MKRTAQNTVSEEFQCAYEDGMYTYTRCTNFTGSESVSYCAKHAEFEDQDDEKTMCDRCGDLRPHDEITVNAAGNCCAQCVSEQAQALERLARKLAEILSEFGPK